MVQGRTGGFLFQKQIIEDSVQFCFQIVGWSKPVFLQSFVQIPNLSADLLDGLTGYIICRNEFSIMPLLVDPTERPNEDIKLPCIISMHPKIFWDAVCNE